MILKISFSQLIYLYSLLIFVFNTLLFHFLSSNMNANVIFVKSSSESVNNEEEKSEREINTVERNDVSYWSGTYILLTIFICLLFVAPWTIIPRTNSIIYQSYWYEILIPISFGMISFAGCDHLNLAIWGKEKSLRKIGVFLRLYLLYSLGIDILYTLCYWIWKIHLGFNHPTPWLIFLYLVLSVIS